MKFQSFFMLFLSAAIAASTTLGTDSSNLVSSSAWKCLAGLGRTYAILRGYQSSGLLDPNAIQNIKNAISGGQKQVDVVLYPCFPCGNAQGQATVLVDSLRGQKYANIWIAVQGSQWSSTVGNNQLFFEDMADAILTLGKKFGIYTSANDWGNIMGDYSYYSGSPLWYYHYNNVQSFSDFQPFSGWTAPTLKQYNASSTLCGTNVGLDWS
ncbi:unnamed protein product [Blepharisma stoltei]|uniref:Glycoside hydrolase family 25 protein n=1 Tax=Blepharisma stoltei TaxID=1481888 RepID=A0AAU9INJ0_9CILI|nr:unnamed protein product [Blepharisma stoltei]